jgi:molybdopterin-guanine dinucleotide biosynthesis protein A
MPPVCVVLAGGVSSRFGADKLLLDVQGRPMLRRIVDALREVCDAVYLSVNSEGRGRGLTRASGCDGYIVDEELGCGGPLLGIATSLGHINADWVLFIPGDVPWITGGTLRNYVEACIRGDADACAPYWGGGYVETLFQLIRGDAARRIREICGLPKVTRASDSLRGLGKTLYVPVTQLSSDPTEFTNVNTPSDLGRRVTRGSWATEYIYVAGRPKELYWAAARALQSPSAARAYFEESLHYESMGLLHIALHAAVDAGNADPGHVDKAVDLRRRLNLLEG